MLDRIDLIVDVPRLSHGELTGRDSASESSVAVRQEVADCRRLQRKRAGKLNCELTTRELDRYCRPDRAGRRLLSQAVRKLELSARGYHRVLRLSRTLADVEQEADITEQHILEALSYREQP